MEEEEEEIGSTMEGSRIEEVKFITLERPKMSIRRRINSAAVILEELNCFFSAQKFSYFVWERMYCKPSSKVRSFILKFK